MNQRSRTEIVIKATPEGVAEEGACRFEQLAQAATTKQGAFSVALSGGNTPRQLHDTLVTLPHRDKIDWSKIHFFWGDERFVPPDDPGSNFQMAQATLLSKLDVPPRNIHCVPTVGVTPEKAAEQYSQTITSFFGASLPRFDLILLGLGPDGHTVSLFPGHPSNADSGTRPVVVVKDSPKPPFIRLTLTLESINHAANIIFLVTGNDKAGIVRKVLQQRDEGSLLPAQQIQPTDGTMVWLLDEDAARDLDN